MKNPFKHHREHGDTLEVPHVPDTPAELLQGHWKHMQRDIDPDCARDPGSDLRADWEMEGAAAEGAVEPDPEEKKPPRTQ